jgi:hypothetical protein
MLRGLRIWGKQRCHALLAPCGRCWLPAAATPVSHPSAATWAAGDSGVAYWVFSSPNYPKLMPFLTQSWMLCLSHLYFFFY